MLLQLQAVLYSPSDRVMYGRNFSPFFFSSFERLQKSCHTFQLSEVNRAGNQTSLEAHIQLAWSLSVCLPWVRIDKRRGQTGFSQKQLRKWQDWHRITEELQATVQGILKEGFCVQFLDQRPAFLYAKLFTQHSSMNSADLHVQSSISQNRMSTDHQLVCLHVSQTSFCFDGLYIRFKERNKLVLYLQGGKKKGKCFWVEVVRQVGSAQDWGGVRVAIVTGDVTAGGVQFTCRCL